MIIACPECAGPFEIPDDRIAALVQVECPHCEFRLILDFEAANDPRLIESGMKMAAGFRSAADYRAAAAPPPAQVEAIPAEPEEIEPEPVEDDAAAGIPVPVPVPEPEPEPEPEDDFDEEPVTRVAFSEEAPTRVPSGRDRLPPVSPAPPPEPVPPVVEAPAPEPEPEHEPAKVAEAPPRGQTVVGPAPTAPEPSPTARGETVVGPPPGPPRLEVELDDSLEEDEPTAIRTIEPPRAAVEAKRATPEPEAKVERKTAKPAVEEEPPTAPRKRAPKPDFDRFPTAPEEAPASPLGTMVLVLLVLIAVGLVAASVVREGTPDPRPLLEKLYRQYVK